MCRVKPLVSRPNTVPGTTHGQSRQSNRVQGILSSVTVAVLCRAFLIALFYLRAFAVAFFAPNIRNRIAAKHPESRSRIVVYLENKKVSLVYKKLLSRGLPFFVSTTNTRLRPDSQVTVHILHPIAVLLYSPVI